MKERPRATVDKLMQRVRSTFKGFRGLLGLGDLEVWASGKINCCRSFGVRWGCYMGHARNLKQPQNAYNLSLNDK